MPKFTVQMRDQGGRRRQQTVEAKSRDEVLSMMIREKVTVLSVTQEAQRAARGFSFAGLWGGPPRPKIKTKDMVVFTRQFSTMISAGIPVVECLEILTDQADDPGFKHTLRTVVNDVSGGMDLSQAMRNQPKIFSRIYVNMIKAGESAGQLDDILSRLAGFLESAEALRSKVKGAMTYPIISLAVILSITTALMLGIIPKFEQMFSALKNPKTGEPIPLPAATQLVMGISKFMQNYWYIMIFGSVGLFIAIRLWKKTKSGGLLWDKLMLKLPVFGSLFKLVGVGRFCRTLSTLLRAGVPILSALEIVQGTVGNRVIEDAIGEARDSIRGGSTVAEPLGRCAVFPPMVVRMIEVGERAGALEQLLEKVSEFYEQEVNAAVEALTSMIEPILIVTMGVIVGGIVLAVFMPIFKLQTAFQK